MNIMLIFYRASVESILRYGITSWFGHLTVTFQSQITRLAKNVRENHGHVQSPPITSPQGIFKQAVIRKSLNITSNPSYVLNQEYVLMQSGRRYRTHSVNIIDINPCLFLSQLSYSMTTSCTLPRDMEQDCICNALFCALCITLSV